MGGDESFDPDLSGSVSQFNWFALKYRDKEYSVNRQHRVNYVTCTTVNDLPLHTL